MRIAIRGKCGLAEMAAVWAIRKFMPRAADAAVTFVFFPPMLDRDDVAIGVRSWSAAPGRAVPRGYAGSDFEAIVDRYASPEDRLALRALTAEINAEVSRASRSRRRHSRHMGGSGLASDYQALWTALHGHTSELIPVMSSIFSAWLAAGRVRWAPAVFDAEVALAAGDGRVAIVNDPRAADDTVTVLFERGVHVVIVATGKRVEARSSDHVAMDDPAFRALVETAGERFGPEPDDWRASLRLLSRAEDTDVSPEAFAAVASALLAGAGV